MFKRLLIANRGEIACRIIKTAKQMGITCIAVYSEVDANALHVKLADEAYALPGKTSQESYLQADLILQIAKDKNIDAIHPGYGFLSENASFAEACAKANIIFVGPPAKAITAMGSKATAKALMAKAKVPIIPGYHGAEQSPEKLAKEAEKIGYPVLLKAAAGGGGKGMRVVNDKSQFADLLAQTKREAKASFNDEHILIEKYLSAPRHVEMQIFMDQQGQGVYLFERDCSIQRRHQKVIEEAPAPNFSDANRKKMGEAALDAARAINYVGAGTIEFLYHDDNFYFMEMNTRLQVEHPVTEMITGLDLVEWQLRIAAGAALPKTQEQMTLSGHAFEVRIYAEDPERDFLPATGTINYLSLPEEDKQVRIDTGVMLGDTISPYYDPMLAKLIVHAEDREQARRKLSQALAEYHLLGLRTNIAYLQRLINHPEFSKANVSTHFIDTWQQDLAKPALSSEQQAILFCEASLFLFLQQQNELKQNPWANANAWQLNLSKQQDFNLTYGDITETINLTIHENSLTCCLQQMDLKLTISHAELSQTQLSYQINAELKQANIVQTEDNIVIFKQAHQYEIRLAKAEWEADEQAGHGHFLAPMPGTIVAIPATTEDKLTTGSALLILEAMKMEHTITAPCAGRVKEFFFAVGDPVEEGVELLTFEAETD